MALKKKAKGQLIVLSGPSGVGKSTVIAELLGQRQDIHFPSPSPPESRGWGRQTASTTTLWNGTSLNA